MRLVLESSISVTEPGGSGGRLGIYHNGFWGTVCDRGFGQTDADVVCQQLGYSGAYQYGNVGSLRYTEYSNLSDMCGYTV